MSFFAAKKKAKLKRLAGPTVPAFDRLELEGNDDLNQSIRSIKDLTIDQAARAPHPDKSGRFPLEMKLGDNNLSFDGKEWTSDKSGKNLEDVSSWKSENLRLTEENNHLKLQVQILLDMVASARAERSLLQEKILNPVS